MSAELIADLRHLARFAEQQANEKDPDIHPTRAWYLETAQTALNAADALSSLALAERGEGWDAKAFVLLAEIRQCINDDNLMAAQRKVMFIESMIRDLPAPASGLGA